MVQALPFGEVLEAIDKLSWDEKEALVAILTRRMTEAARQRLVREIQEARQEFKDGRCTVATSGDLMREIMQ